MSVTLHSAGPTPATHPAPFFLPCAERPAVLVNQAVGLWAGGYPVAAAMVARGALEGHAHVLLGRRRRWQFNTCLWKLLKAGTITLPTVHQLGKLFQIGNQSVHCQPVTFDAIERLIYGTHCFVKGGAA